MKDYLVLLAFSVNGITIAPSFHRAESENAALAGALMFSSYPSKAMTFHSVQEVNPDFCVLNNKFDLIADKNVIAIKVGEVKKNSDLTKDLIDLAKKHYLYGIVKALEPSQDSALAD